MSNQVPDGWSIGTLNEFASVKGGKRLPKGEKFSPIKTEYPYVRVTDFKVGSVDQSDLRYVSKSIRDKISRYVISSKDLYISIAGTLGLVGEVPEKLDGALLTENAAKIIFNSSQASDKKFFKYYLNSIEAQEQFNQSKGTGGGVPKLALFRIEDTLVLAPPLPEQQKIAAILTSVDEVIEKTQSQIDKLKDLKTAMMQELLTCGVGVDGKPHTEFKDSPVGRIPKGWDVVQFKDIFNDYKYGPRFSSKDYDERGNVKTIRGTDVSSNGDIKYLQVPTASIEQATVNSHALKDGDLVMITTADCGATAVFRKQNIPYIASAYAIKLTPTNKVNSKYVNYFLQTDDALKQVESFIRKGTVANLPGSDVMAIKLAVPELNEQNKIVSILEKLDEKIAIKSKSIASKVMIKKALMQDLLTGKVRVTVPEASSLKASSLKAFPHKAS
jgi:type I restriction enzyme S subunit